MSFTQEQKISDENIDITERFNRSIKTILKKKNKKRIDDDACQLLAEYLIKAMNMGSQCVGTLENNEKVILKDKINSTGVEMFFNK